MKPTIRACLVLCVCLVASGGVGCTSMQPVVQPSGNVESQVVAGDFVRVVTRDGRHLELEVTAVDDGSLTGRVPDAAGDSDQAAPAGSLVQIAYGEIETLHVKRTDGWKTAGYVGGSIALGYLIGLVLVSALVIIPL